MIYDTLAATQLLNFVWWQAFYPTSLSAAKSFMSLSSDTLRCSFNDNLTRVCGICDVSFPAPLGLHAILLHQYVSPTPLR